MKCELVFVGAELLLEAIPADPSVCSLSRDKLSTALLSGGDDYELVFTAPAEKRGLVEQASISALTPITRIGRVVSKDSQTHRLTVRDAEGRPLPLTSEGFDHFN